MSFPVVTLINLQTVASYVDLSTCQIGKTPNQRHGHAMTTKMHTLYKLSLGQPRALTAPPSAKTLITQSSIQEQQILICCACSNILSFSRTFALNSVLFNTSLASRDCPSDI